MHLLWTITALAGLCAGSPLPQDAPPADSPTVFPGLQGRNTTPDAASQLALIAPKSASCGGGDFADECATAAMAAPFLIEAFQRYKVTCAWEIAYVLSLIALESGEFKYNTNHFPAPGRPGQGTRNMQMAEFNVKYAASIAELAPQAQAITGGRAADALSPDELNQVRALVLPDTYAWASGAWFLSQCSPDVRRVTQQGGMAGWNAYLGCVGVATSSEREAYLTRAVQAFGLSM